MCCDFAQVEQYYQHSFNMLVTVLGVGLFIVGVVVPVVIAYYQRKSFENDRKKFEDQIGEMETKLKADIEDLKNKTQKAILGEVKVINQRFDEEQKKLEKYIDNRTGATRGEFYGQMASIFRDEFKKEATAVMFELFSIIEYATVTGANKIVKESLDEILSSGIKIKATKADVEKIQAQYLTNIAELRKILIKQGKIKDFEEKLKKVEEWIKSNVVVVPGPKKDKA